MILPLVLLQASAAKSKAAASPGSALKAAAKVKGKSQSSDEVFDEEAELQRVQERINAIPRC